MSTITNRSTVEISTQQRQAAENWLRKELPSKYGSIFKINGAELYNPDQQVTGQNNAANSPNTSSKGTQKSDDILNLAKKCI